MIGSPQAAIRGGLAVYGQVAHPSFWKTIGVPHPSLLSSEGWETTDLNPSPVLQSLRKKKFSALNRFPKSEPARDQRFEISAHPCRPIPLQRVNWCQT